MKVLLAGFAALLATAAFAQSDNRPATATEFRTAQAEPQKTDAVPPGGCMPIGLTARGDMVFPMQCREVIERERGPVPAQAPEQRSQQEPPKIAPAEKVDLVTTGLTQERPRKRISRVERQKLLRPASDPVVTGSTRPMVTGSNRPSN